MSCVRFDVSILFSGVCCFLIDFQFHFTEISHKSRGINSDSLFLSFLYLVYQFHSSSLTIVVYSVYTSPNDIDRCNLFD